MMISPDFYNNREMRPIFIFAVVLVALGVGGTLFFLFGTSPAPFFDPHSPSEIERTLFYLVLGTNLFYVATGLGLMMLKRWGFLLFKWFLFMAVLAFPVGTIISYITLSYIKKYRIQENFV